MLIIPLAMLAASISASIYMGFVCAPRSESKSGFSLTT